MNRPGWESPRFDDGRCEAWSAPARWGYGPWFRLRCQLLRGHQPSLERHTAHVDALNCQMQWTADQ